MSKFHLHTSFFLTSGRKIRKPWRAASLWLAGLACAAWPWSGATALPMYGFSTNAVFASVTATDSEGNKRTFLPSSFSGEHAAEHALDGRDTQGPAVNPRQAKSGPGPFPAEDSYTPQGEVGRGYARADTCTSDFFRCAESQSRNVAEVFRTSMGTAQAQAELILLWQFKVGPGEDVAVGWSAAPAMRVHTTGEREIAIATIDFFVAVSGLGPAQALFSWVPCGDPADSGCRSRDPSVTVFDIKDPFDLSTSIACIGSCEKSYGGEHGGFGITLRGLGGADGREIGVFMRATETAGVLIPEPASSSLLILGMLALTVIRGRRARSVTRRRCISG
jgi:hypothetical protein